MINKEELATRIKLQEGFRLLNSEIGNDQNHDFQLTYLAKNGFRLLNSEIGNDHKSTG